VKYSNIEFTPTPIGGGFILTSSKSPRVLLVNADGVFECARDGSEKPLELIDCGELTLVKVKASLGDAGAAELLKQIEVKRRARMLEDSAKAAVDAALKQIAAADAKAAKP